MEKQIRRFQLAQKSWLPFRLQLTVLPFILIAMCHNSVCVSNRAAHVGSLFSKRLRGRPFEKTFDSNLKIDAAGKHAHKLLADVADWTAGDHTKPCPMTQPLDGRLTFQKAFEMYLNAPGKRVTNKEKADARRWYLFNHSSSRSPLGQWTN